MSSPNVSFTQIPANIRKPGIYLEENTSNALQGLTAANDKVVILAQRTPSGIVAAKVPTKVFSDADAALDFGRGSVAHLATKAAMTANPYVDLTVVGIDDDPTAIKATGKIKLSGTATRAGTGNIWIGDVGVHFAIASGSTALADTSAAYNALQAALSTNPLPVTYAQSDSTLTLTAINGGKCGNYIPLSVKTDSDITMSTTAMASGAADPDVGAYDTSGTVLNSIAAGGYSIIVSTLPDAANLAKIKTMVAWASGPMEQRPAVYVAGMTDIIDSYSNIKTLGGTTLNDGRASLPYISYASDNLAKTEPYKVGAGYAAVLASTSDPAVPYDGAVIANVAAPAVIDRWTRTQQEDLLNNGVTPLAVIPGELVSIVRAISTYTLNSQSLADPTLLDLTTIRSLDYVRAQIRSRLSARFQRAKLSSRTPKLVRSQILDVLYLLQGLEIVQDVDTWKSGVIVERDTQSVGQMNCKIPAAVVPGLHVICGVIDLILY